MIVYLIAAPDGYDEKERIGGRRLRRRRWRRRPEQERAGAGPASAARRADGARTK
jgi:hypothetical protein